MSPFGASPAAPVRDEGLRSGHLLLVDDEPDNLELLEGMLSRTRYNTTRAAHGEAALQRLREAPERYDAVLLDRMTPVMDGIAVLREMKSDPRLKDIPVILQTAAGNAVQIGEGLAAGAYYYLVKPFDRRQLLPVVNGAVANHQAMRELRRRLQQANPFGMIVHGIFRLHTLGEARELASWLARASADPGAVAFGLQELLVNAIEHGCLELGYEAKRAHLAEGDYEQELARRAADPRYAGRHVDVEVARSGDAVIYTISDPGSGFAHARYQRVEAGRLLDPNGRGILMARELSFDEVVYEGCGNRVRAHCRLPAAAVAND